MITAGDGQYQAFISYSSRDQAWADAACAALEQAGHRCWIAPRDITAGTEWGAAIIEGIDRCRIMVLIFSRHADASTQVRREVERAIAKGMSILPLRIEDVQPRGAMEYALSSTHWLDAFAPPPQARLLQLTESVTALLEILSRTPLASPDTTVKPDTTNMQTAVVPGSQRTAWLATSVAIVAIVVCVALAIWGRSGAPLPSANTDISTQSVTQPLQRVDPESEPAQIVLNGTWTGSSGSVFTMHATLIAAGARLTGQIRWRLISFPSDRPELIDKENAVGIEEVTGTLSDTELVIAGTSISDPTWLGVGVYRVSLNKEAGTFAVSNAEGDAVSGSGSGTYVMVQ